MERNSIQKVESLNFYKYLCNKIGSEEVVKIRRLTYGISDIGHPNKLITSGSKGEGLNLKTSDLDVMVISNDYVVYQSETEVLEVRKATFIMNTEDTQPGYSQLYFLTNHGNLKMIPISILVNMLRKKRLRDVLSSEQFRRFMLSLPYVRTMVEPKVHGPCISDKYDRLDIVWCLKCDKWVFQAHPWVSRPRTKWPPHELISKIISFGVLFVPIGCKGSINEHLEWRISFSVAEKCLIFSFSHTQFLCYALLKILLKEIVEQHGELKGLLCSYFLKTLMFWIAEETESYLWKPDNIIPCFMACLQRRLYCVRYSILSHYFIPDNNLFFSRFNITIKNQMNTILKNVYEQGISCFASSETLPDYHSYSFKIAESVISRNVRFVQQLMPTFLTMRCTSNQDNISRLLYEFLHNLITGSSRGLFAIQISAAFMVSAETTNYQNTTGNKSHYLRYKLDLSHLMIGLHSDSVSGLLMLASFFYVHENYFASLVVISYTLQKYTDEKIETGLCFRKK
ncbi:Hypothetical predicted protein [Mytilus galloprovincialis]|uniref:Mab-21-like HhH/H2TH-like domain-containing protein n=1 Tax=Mytilus galloprovincialis TaxID=29158 RepID=A0A8B6HQD1_MYTGA|nr:Hypothetical predicted protein [Mytilus galloprovincialis]